MSRVAATVLFFLGAGLALTGAARAQTPGPFIKAQAPCGSKATNFFCKRFNPLDGPGEIRAMTVNFPAKGLATVSFTGNVWCVTGTGRITYRLDLQLRADSQPPDPNGPGSLSCGYNSTATKGDYLEGPVTALRPFAVGAGAKTFRLMGNFDSTLASCNINGGQMTVTFIPNERNCPGCGSSLSPEVLSAGPAAAPSGTWPLP